MPGRVLICDDEALLRETVDILLRRAGHETSLATGVKDAIATIDREPPFDAIITDLLMPGGSGMDVLEAAKKKDEATEVIVITAHASTAQAVEAMRLGAYDFVEKPFRNDHLRATLDKALEKHAIRRENRALRARLEGAQVEGTLLGKSAAMEKVRRLVDRVTDAPTSVLITGESGTGKEMVARALHYRGGRSEAPFVVVNCGALPQHLMESELFGHVKGAFTGADRQQPGLFRSAEGGTLFLDEIGELPLDLQVKLLRALQEKKVRPVGGSEEVSVNVRVVAATNTDMEIAVEEGRFRQDLFYRLNVLRIHVPPLRDRPEDVAELAEHFVHKHARAQGRELELSPAARRWLLRQRYQGNVRELENLVERAATLCQGSVIEVEDLDLSGPPPPNGHGPKPSGERLPSLGEGFDLDAHLAGIERRLLYQALDEAEGVRTRAAELLGMTFRSFRYRLAKHEQDTEERSTADEAPSS